MYFNFEDYHPDTPRLPRSLTRLEVALLTVVFYLSVVILLLLWPHLPFVKEWEVERQQQLAKLAQEQLERQRESPRFVFVQPRVDLQAPKPPPRADLSDMDRKARTVERAAKPTNNMPFSRGNTFERTEGAPPTPQQRGQEAAQPETEGRRPSRQGPSPPLPESPTGCRSERREVPQRGPSAGVLLRMPSELYRNDGAARLVREPSGGRRRSKISAPSIQFDTKGVEFGPWLRRFIAQIFVLQLAHP